MSRTPTDEALDPYNILGRLQVAVAAGILFVLVYALTFVRSGFGVVLGVGLLTAGASLLVGFLLGFIFGIPRTAKGSSSSSSSGQQRGENGQEQSGDDVAMAPHSNVDSNSNLVEISDWLTKILVGVGLVELGKIPAKVKALTSYVGGGLSGCGSVTSQDAGQAVALGVMVFFSCAGFLIGYLWARLYFYTALSNLGKLLAGVYTGFNYYDMADDAADANRLADALRYINLALRSDRRNAAAHLLKGWILKHMALQPEQTPETKKQLLEEALDEATQSRKLGPKVAGASYNIACYQALLGRGRADILKNLQEAFRLDPKLKAQAKGESDLQSIRDDADFKAITAAA